MPFRQFVPPTDSEIESVLGITVTVGVEPTVRVMRLQSADDYQLDFTVDGLARSVCLTISKDDRVLATIVRSERPHVSESPPELGGYGCSKAASASQRRASRWVKVSGSSGHGR